MSRLTPEEAKAQFPKGTAVRVKEAHLVRWMKETAGKLKDRVGQITCYLHETDQLLVTFPSTGRRRRHQQRIYADGALEVVTDADEVADLQALMQEDEAQLQPA